MKKWSKSFTALHCIMKISCLQLLLAVVFTGLTVASTSTAQDLLSRTVSVRVDNKGLRTILNRLEKAADVKFTYVPQLIETESSLSLRATNDRLEVILDRLLKPLNITYQVSGKYIVLRKEPTGSIMPLVTTAQAMADRIITGTVTDEKGDALPGVSVLLKGTQRGTTTDSQGAFRLAVPDQSTGQEVVLVFSFVGYQSQEVSPGNSNGQPQTALVVRLVADNKSLNEVVVVGYGTVKKRDLTGSVASVPVADVRKLVLTSPDQAIQGRAAGVLVTQNSSAPGAGTTVRIRGGNSIQGGNEPLYVIDGIPIYNDLGTNGATTNPLSAINTNDIENIEVLKDASATAIYGSRGANGVVIITTRRGKSGQSKIEFDAYYGVQTVRRKYPLLNALEFTTLANEANTNEGRNPVYTPAQIESFGAGTDWQDEVFQQAPIQNYQLTFSGGDDRTQYALGGNYFNQQGIVLNSGFSRGSIRLNLDRKATDRLKVGTSLTLSRTVANRVGSDGNLGATGSVVSGALRFPPILPVYNPDGSYLITNPFLTITTDNPVALAREGRSIGTTFRLLGSVFGEYRILDGLTLRVLAGLDGIYDKSSTYNPKSVLAGLQQGGVASIYNAQNLTWLNENTLTYVRTINQIHSLNLLAGYTQQANRFEFSQASARNFANDNLDYNNLGAGSVPLTPSSGVGTWSLLSYIARINYGYKDRYLLTLTGRADGSSRFGVNHRFGYFPSGSVAWRVIDEPFMNGQPLLDDLKLRVSYGLTGNQEGIGNYPAYSLLATQNYTYNGLVASGTGPSQVANPDLKWESTAQFDAGVDMALLNNRLQITADVYQKRTRDLLLNITIPAASGYTTALKNIGQVENRGVEFAFTSRNIVKPLAWTTNFNITFNRNKVLDIGGVPQIIVGQFANIGSVGGTNLIRVGEPLGSLFGYVTDGLFQQTDDIAKSAQPTAKPGDRRYKDLNSDGKLDDNDRAIIGQAQPTAFFGLTNTLTFKGLELTVFFQGVRGNSILNANRFELESLAGDGNQDRDVLSRWTPTNTNTDIPRATTTRPANRISTRQIEDGSYVRLKNVQLAYSLPATLCRAIRLQSVRAYVTAQNYLTWTKYSGFDPEVSRFGQDNRSQGFDYGSYPAAKTLLFGLNIAF